MPSQLYSEALIRRLFAALSTGATTKHAAGFCGIDESTVYKWLKRSKKGDEEYADFARRYHEARAAGAVKLVSTMHLKALGGWVEDPKTGTRVYVEPDTKAAQWLLQHCHGYTAKSEVEVRHAAHDGGPLIPDLAELTVEKLRALAGWDDEDEQRTDPVH
jgi:hypothetical protein